MANICFTDTSIRAALNSNSAKKWHLESRIIEAETEFKMKINNKSDYANSYMCSAHIHARSHVPVSHGYGRLFICKFLIRHSGWESESLTCDCTPRLGFHSALSFGANQNVLLAHIRLLFEIYANFKTEKNVSESTRVASKRTDKKKKKTIIGILCKLCFSFLPF